MSDHLPTQPIAPPRTWNARTAEAPAALQDGVHHLSPDLIRYVLLPAAAALVLLAAYYAGVPGLADIVAPAVNRELGLLEHAQALVLGALTVTTVRAAGRAAPGTTARHGWLVAAAVAAGVLLEELDYGRHHALLLAGRPEAWSAVPPPALHNRPVGRDHEVVDYLKAAANVGLALWFVLLPLVRRFGALRGSAAWQIVSRWVAPWLPSAWSAATVLVFVGVSRLAHALQDATRAAGAGPRALDGNVSEFGELIVYYLVALYVRDRALRGRAGGPALAGERDGAGPVRLGRAVFGSGAATPRPGPLAAKSLRCLASRC